MNESKISVRYSKALFELAKEEKVLDLVMTDQELLQSIYKLPEFKLLLENPVIKSSQKQKVLRQIFEGKLNKITLTFLDLLIQNKREIFLPDITRKFIDEYHKEKGILPVTITSAVKIDDEHDYAAAAESVRKLKFMEKLAEEIASAFDAIDI